MRADHPFPFEPVEAARIRNGLDVKSLPQNVARIWYRARAEGCLTLQAADTICTGMGLHPWEVFGEYWFQIPFPGSESPRKAHKG